MGSFLCARDLQCDVRERYERQQEGHLAVAERISDLSLFTPFAFSCAALASATRLAASSSAW